MATINNLTRDEDGTLQYVNEKGINAEADLALLLIRQVWGAVCFENEADGYGEGSGTDGDWSSIRDSSFEAQTKMLEKALNHLLKK
jgi:hypothetical protein